MKYSVVAKWGLLAAACAILGWFYGAPFTSLQNNSPKPVSIALAKTPLSTPFYVALEKNYFDKSCVTLKVSEVIGGHNSFSQMISGQADLSTSSDSVMAYQLMENSNFVNLATFVESDNDIKVVLREGIDFKANQKLKVGLVKGSASEYFFSQYTAINQINDSQLDVQFLNVEQMPDALQSAQVDSVVAWEPYAFQSLQSNQRSFLEPTKNLYTLTFNLLARRGFVAQNAKATRCILEALQKANYYIASNPESAKKILLKKLDINAQVVDWVWPDYIFRLNLNRSMLMSIDSQITWAMQQGKIPTAPVPDLRQFVQPSALLALDPSAVNID
ncbi:ABC transporter substrate-binding protein [Aliikangiella sp. IMCC44653]